MHSALKKNLKKKKWFQVIKFYILLKFCIKNKNKRAQNFYKCNNKNYNIDKFR
jgi:hypothetical protein